MWFSDKTKLHIRNFLAVGIFERSVIIQVTTEMPLVRLHTVKKMLTCKASLKRAGLHPMNCNK